VFCADSGVSKLLGLIFGVQNRVPGRLSESLEHLALPWLLCRRPTGVLLVHRLLTDFERFSDLLPGPALPPGVVHLKRFEGLGESP
jgi:hypothetical protein